MENRIIYQLYKAEHKLKNFMKKLSRDNNIEISAGESGVLFLLQKKQFKMSELSQKLGIDNSAVTRLVDRLEAKKLALREVNPLDRRQYLICLTKKGESDVKILTKLTNKTNKKIKDGFTKEEVDIFLRVLASFEKKFK
ncbi:MAG: MarR family transcriptional regulator [Deltaproteobacteria bacterium]|nr:MarR family transcriptional regulator [Deltaproteobacteria bacterium]